MYCQGDGCSTTGSPRPPFSAILSAVNPFRAIILLYVGLGGAAGSVMRYALSVTVQSRVGAGFPVATLIINVVGSFLLGALMAYFSEEATTPPEVQLLLTTGFCRGFTTFSTFSWEAFRLSAMASTGAPWRTSGRVPPYRSSRLRLGSLSRGQ